MNAISIPFAGSELTYRLVSHRETKSWRKYWSNINTPKAHTPLIDECINKLGTDGMYHSLVFIDIDDSPVSCEQLKAVLPGAIVFPTPSNNAKAAFTLISEHPVNVKDITEALKFHVPDYINYDRAGLTRCYVTFEAANALAKGLTTVRSLYCDSTLPVSNIIKEYKYTSIDQIPTEMAFWVGGCSHRLKLVQLLVACWSLNKTTGFNLPVTKVAHHCGVTPKTSSKWLYDLQKLGFLKCIDRSYLIGHKARTYVALGCLAKAILKHRTNHVKKTLLKAKITEIPEGKFFHYCKKLLWQFRNHQEWMEFVTPFCNRKNRLKDAERYGKWHFNKAARDNR